MAISRMPIVIVLVVIIIAAVIAGVILTPKQGALQSTTQSTNTFAGPSNSSELYAMENGSPLTFDPASSYFVMEENAVTNVYQGLVIFNYTSTTEMAPILAASWTVDSGYKEYLFSLRQNAYFMNGHPFDASVVWFNFYRTILMNQAGAYFFVSMLYDGNAALSTGYAVPWGTVQALQAAGYSITTNSSMQQEQAAQYLADILSHFDPSNSTIQKVMSYPNQAVVVVSSYQVRFNLMNPYALFLTVLATPNAGLVDPAFVDANGGVSPNAENTYVNLQTMGTGPYYVKSYIQGSVLTMQANPNYWAAKLSPGESNVMLTPPHIPVVVIQCAQTATQLVEGIERNQVALLGGCPSCSDGLAPMYLPSVSTVPGVVVAHIKDPTQPKPTWFELNLDTQKYPLNITDFRVALAHAINYTELIDSVIAGYGVPYLGPLAPGFPHYNPDNLPPYDYDPATSIRLLANLGFTLDLPNGTTVNPGGKIPDITLTYITGAAESTKVAQELQVMWANIGLHPKLAAITSSELSRVVAQPATAASYPQMFMWYWGLFWYDDVYQGIVVQVNSLYGGIGGDASWFDNATVNTLTSDLPFITDQATVRSRVAEVYRMVYQQAPVIWLYAWDPFWVQRDYLHGTYYNIAVYAWLYALMYYDSSSTNMINTSFALQSATVTGVAVASSITFSDLAPRKDIFSWLKSDGP